MIVVQRVRTHWTKVSRGGTEAARRNAVPEALAVPSAGRAGVLVHAVEAREYDDFVPSDEVWALDEIPAAAWLARALDADDRRRNAGRRPHRPEPDWRGLETRTGVDELAPLF